MSKRKRFDENLTLGDIIDALAVVVDGHLSMKQTRRGLEQHLGFEKGALKNATIEDLTLEEIIMSYYDDTEKVSKDPEEVPTLTAPLLKRTVFNLLLERGTTGIELSTKEFRKLVEEQIGIAPGASKAVEGFSIKRTIRAFKEIQTVQGETDSAVERANQVFFKNNSDDPYSYDLLKHAFIYMNTLPSTGLLTPKQLGEALERELLLASGALKNKTTELLCIIEDYKMVLKKRVLREQNGPDSLIKYSKKEKRIIMGITREYMVQHNLRVEDIVPYLRKDYVSVRGKLNKPKERLVTDIFRVFPYRSYDALFNQLTHQLTSFMATGVWTEEQERHLVFLHDIYGNDWSAIARILGKRRNDCYNAYVRTIFPRRQGITHKFYNVRIFVLSFVHTGLFSDKEKMDLIRAVRKVLGKMNEPLSKLPYLGIPWKQVCELMGRGRDQLTYRVSSVRCTFNTCFDSNSLYYRPGEIC